MENSSLALGLDTAIHHYGDAIATLETQPTPAIILAALIARDSIEAARQPPGFPILAPTADLLIELIDLDQRLRQQAGAIHRTIDLAAWQRSFSPPETAWWWFLDPPIHPLDRYDWLWSTLTVVALTGSGSLLVDISSRFLSGGPGLWGSFVVISQSVATLGTAGGVLTQTGRQLIENAIATTGIQRPLWQETKLGLSLLLLLTLAGFRTSLPYLAERLTHQGETVQTEGNYPKAESSYKRAIALDPNNAEARYQLAGVYESLGRSDTAEEQLLLAVNSGFLPAYNQLALLYLNNDNPDKAAALLTQALEEIGDSPNTLALRADLLTSLGWARFQQHRYQEAEANLQQSLALGGDSLLGEPTENIGIESLPIPSTPTLGDQSPIQEDEILAMEQSDLVSASKSYCLLAQVSTATGNTTLAETAAVQCVQQADRTNPQEDAWAYSALEQLQSEATPVSSP
ncbi:tetratricopeptide repeat protein [Leptolyngbya sp. PCC 6406]|uniref:tetratricopeptide repeat protein n=1 Tax=Leptolyngbya sp. PCC 6406 TaxID=1173264 RepID=UPI0002ABA8B7|nr:tetratricopeptide repeat protein [Leptolyngbya sp. PCC 6406]